MRDYAKVSSTFWTGDTGRTLRRNPDAQRLAMYVMTAPTANMIGLYYLPVPTICHDVGMKTEGALKALRSLFEGGLARYDEASGWIWVVEMARYQIGDELNEKDNRVKSIQKMVDASVNCPFVKDFCDKYGPLFHVVLPRGFKAPSKPLRSQEQEQEQEKEQEQEQKGRRAADAAPTAKRFVPPTVDEVRAYCTERMNKIDPQRFVDHYTANGWKQGRGKPVVDWQACVRTWEQNDFQGASSVNRPSRLNGGQLFDGAGTYGDV